MVFWHCKWSYSKLTLKDGLFRMKWTKNYFGNITLKARQARLHWYGHILRLHEGNKMKQTMKMEKGVSQTTSGMTKMGVVWQSELPETGEDDGGWYRTRTSILAGQLRGRRVRKVIASPGPSRVVVDWATRTLWCRYIPSWSASLWCLARAPPPLLCRRSSVSESSSGCCGSPPRTCSASPPGGV